MWSAAVALLGIVDLGRVGSLDRRLAVLDLEKNHRQARLIVIVEGHLADRARIVDLGERRADLLAVDALGLLDRLGEKMGGLPVHIGMVVGRFAVLGGE